MFFNIFENLFPHPDSILSRVFRGCRWIRFCLPFFFFSPACWVCHSSCQITAQISQYFDGEKKWIIHTVYVYSDFRYSGKSPSETTHRCLSLVSLWLIIVVSESLSDCSLAFLFCWTSPEFLQTIYNIYSMWIVIY